MNVHKVYGLQERSTRHTYQRLFLKNKICSFLIVLWEMLRPLCVRLMRTSDCSGSKLSARYFSRRFYKGIKLS